MSERRLVKVAGHTHSLYVQSYSSSCGDIRRGIAFEFDNQGGWVVDLADLKAVIAEAEAHQAALDARNGEGES